MLKNKDFKTIYYNAGNRYYQRKVVSQVNLVIPPVVNRLISVRELRTVAIKHLVELSVEHDFFLPLFSKKKTCHVFFFFFFFFFFLHAKGDHTDKVFLSLLKMSDAYRNNLYPYRA